MNRGVDDVPLTEERLVDHLTMAVSALGMEAASAAADGGGGGGGPLQLGGAEMAHRVTVLFVGNLKTACRFEDPSSPAARVPLPWPCPKVDGALSALARFIEGGRSPGHARVVADGALRAVHGIAITSPLRVAVLARHPALMAALAAALGVRGDAAFISAAISAAQPLLIHTSTIPATAPAFWRAANTAPCLRALAAAYAGAFGALEACRDGGIDEDFEDSTSLALPAALAACPEPHKSALGEALLRQRGFVDALAACIARGAAAAPVPATTRAIGLQGGGALTMVAALGSGGSALEMVRSASSTQLHFEPIFLMPPPPAAAAAMDKLLAAAPALLERAADVVAAHAAWYAAVSEALRRGRAPGGRTARGMLVSRFGDLEIVLLKCAVAVLLLVRPRTLTGGGRGSSPFARLAPALLAMGEAARGVAGALPAPDLLAVFTVSTDLRDRMAGLAAGALRVLKQAVDGDAAAAASQLDDDALAALVRFSASDPPLLAEVGSQPSLINTARRVAHACGCARLFATEALAALCAGSARPRIAALLAASPTLAAAVGAAVGPTRSERQFPASPGASAPDGHASLSARRVPAAGVVTLLARGEAAGGSGSGSGRGGSGASWLRGLLR